MTYADEHPQPMPMTPASDTSLDWLRSLSGRRHDAMTRANHGIHTAPAGTSADFATGLPEHLVWFVADGSCDITSHQRRSTITPGSVLWVKPRVPFGLAVDPAHAMTIYRFRLEASNDAGGFEPAILTVDNAWSLRPVFERVISELDTSLPMRDESLSALLTVLFVGLLRDLDRDVAGNPLSDASRARVERFISANIAARPSIEDLAAVAGLSPAHFSRKFRATYGVPPRTWVVQRRVQAACALLDLSPDSVTQIARRLGYPDVFLFSRQFKAVLGMSPSAYRDRGRVPTPADR